jgi:hypothetical protein
LNCKNNSKNNSNHDRLNILARAVHQVVRRELWLRPVLASIAIGRIFLIYKVYFLYLT